MSILYPVAANADQALAQPVGRAAREREARTMAADAVTFTTEVVGPAFSSREAALTAYRGKLEDPWSRLVEQVVAERRRTLGPVAAVNRDGRRWPEPPPEPPTVWRLSISYWRIGQSAEPGDAPQARQARRSGDALDAKALRAIAEQPLRPVKPQQPLDIGLFEVRLPENPSIVMPDE